MHIEEINDHTHFHLIHLHVRSSTFPFDSPPVSIFSDYRRQTCDQLHSNTHNKLRILSQVPNQIHSKSLNHHAQIIQMTDHHLLELSFLYMKVPIQMTIAIYRFLSNKNDSR